MMAETFVRQAPTHTADSCFFCELRPAACELRLFCVYFMSLLRHSRIRRGRPKYPNPSSIERLPGRMVAAGGPLRAEGFPKRRC